MFFKLNPIPSVGCEIDVVVVSSFKKTVKKKRCSVSCVERISNVS